ncbi:hypothetical protein JCM5353_005994 [Sporobolomyces roseus]
MTTPVSATQAQAILQLLAEAANQHLQSQFAPPPPPAPPLAPAHSPRTTSTTTKKRTTRHSSSSRTTNPSPLSTSHTTPSQSLPSLQIAPHSDIIHPPTDTDDAEPTEEQEDPATLLFNDYFDFPSSDEDDDPDFLPRLTPADSTAGQPTPLTQGQVEQDDDEEEAGGRDWWADVFGRGADESEDEEDEDDDEEEEEVVGLTREEFEKELALLTGEVEGFNTLNQNQPSSRERQRGGNHDRIGSLRGGDTPDASNLTATPSTTTTKTSKKRSSSKKSKDSSQPIPSDDPTPRTSPRRKRTSTDPSSLQQDEEPDRRPTKKSKSSSSSSKKSKKSRPLSPPALSPIPELPTFAPPPPHSRLPSTLSPDPPPIASTSTSKLTSTREPKKLRPRAIYTEEEAKERRKAQERERQARKRAKAIEDKEAMEQKIKLLEFSLGEWKTRATTAEKRVRELLEVQQRERGRSEREEADDEEEEESDGGEFVMEENGREEGDSTEESSSEEEEEEDEDGEDGDQVTRMVDEGRGLETELGQPQMDLNLSNLGQGDLNQLLALVQNAAMAQGIQLEGSSNGARAGGG